MHALKVNHIAPFSKHINLHFGNFLWRLYPFKKASKTQFTRLVSKRFCECQLIWLYNEWISSTMHVISFLYLLLIILLCKFHKFYAGFLIVIELPLSNYLKYNWILIYSAFILLNMLFYQVISIFLANQKSFPLLRNQEI